MLSKKAKLEMENILDKLERANKKLYSENVAFCGVQKQVTTNRDYTRSADNRVLTEFNKFCGSEICFYSDIAKSIERFIANN